MAAKPTQADGASLAAATRVTKLDSHAYKVELGDAFCIGNGMHQNLTPAQELVD